MDPFRRGYMRGRLNDLSVTEIMESGEWGSFSRNQKDVLIRLLKADNHNQKEQIKTLNQEIADNQAFKRQKGHQEIKGKKRGVYGGPRVVRNPCYELGNRELVSWEDWRAVYWACEVPPTLPRNLRKDETSYLEA
jgi:hypothetical protein